MLSTEALERYDCALVRRLIERLQAETRWNKRRPILAILFRGLHLSPLFTDVALNSGDQVHQCHLATTRLTRFARRRRSAARRAGARHPNGAALGQGRPGPAEPPAAPLVVDATPRRHPLLAVAPLHQSAGGVAWRGTTTWTGLRFFFFSFLLFDVPLSSWFSYFEPSD